MRPQFQDNLDAREWLHRTLYDLAYLLENTDRDQANRLYLDADQVIDDLVTLDASEVNLSLQRRMTRRLENRGLVDKEDDEED